jgi:protein kinase-like protein/AAA ATPase-like protein
MHSELWQGAMSLLGVVIELAPDQRSSYLDRVCHDNPELRREVDSLLAAHASADKAFDQTIAQPVPAHSFTSEATTNEPTVSPGDHLGHYEVLAFIGAGGMGEVYRARDPRLRRDVALKVLPSAFANDRDRLSRFEQEARAAAVLNHPNICTVHDVGEANGRSFIAMELIEGDTLRVLIGRSQVRSRAAEIGAQVAKALAAAHTAGIVHGDIKPENLMLRSDGYVKILDFGLALERPLENLRIRAVGDIENEAESRVWLGTPRYMSPEQIRGEKLQSSTDIFSLGIVLYELATGRYPFELESESSVLHAILEKAPPRPSQFNPELTLLEDSLILRMLGKDPSLRPGAEEVYQVLAGSAARRSGQDAVLLPVATPILRRHAVGRSREKQEPAAVFESVIAGKGKLVCIAGEPGVRKTTLVEYFLSGLQAQSFKFSLAKRRCFERPTNAEAYLPFLEALGLPHNDSGVSARTLGEFTPSWYAQLFPLSESDPDASLQAHAQTQQRVKREFVALFVQIASDEKTLVLFFDDLHWIDAVLDQSSIGPLSGESKNHTWELRAAIKSGPVAIGNCVLVEMIDVNWLTL